MAHTILLPKLLSANETAEAHPSIFKLHFLCFPLVLSINFCPVSLLCDAHCLHLCLIGSSTIFYLDFSLFFCLCLFVPVSKSKFCLILRLLSICVWSSFRLGFPYCCCQTSWNIGLFFLIKNLFSSWPLLESMSNLSPVIWAWNKPHKRDCAFCRHIRIQMSLKYAQVQWTNQFSTER